MTVLWCMQALLELQRQHDSTRISSTRELTRRVSSSQTPPLPPQGTAESNAALAAWDHQRSQSQSFTGGLSPDLPVNTMGLFKRSSIAALINVATAD